jgi:RNA polymerase sigma-70 factor (sigma-E family)
VDEQSAPLPGIDEYVVARGGDLLRTAWLLTGDRHRAEDLVRTALGKALPHWRHIAASEAGHHDADVRRLMMTSYTAGRRHGRGDGRPSQHPSGQVWAPPDPRDVEDAVLRRDVLRALDGLPRVQRAVIVLRYFDDLSEAQTADALELSPGTVRSQSTRALAALAPTLAAPASGPHDPQWKLRDALGRTAPSSPSVDGLADSVRGYAARVRRRRRRTAASLTAVALVAAGTLALATGPELPFLPRPDPVPMPTVTSTQPVSSGLAFQSCQLPTIPLTGLSRNARPPSQRYDAVLVCARTDQDSVWSGSLPPDDVVAAPEALDSLRIEPRDEGVGCPPLPSGPAFRLLVRSKDGAVAYLPNEALRCQGWEMLASYFVAVAEQRGSPEADPLDGGYLGCPPLWQTPSTTVLTTLPRGTVLATATICLHPLVEATLSEVPRLRPMRGGVLGEVQLGPLNEELARRGTVRSPRAPCTQQSWVYVLRAVTADRRLVELAGNCPHELEVVGAPGNTLRLGAAASSVLRGSVLGS